MWSLGVLGIPNTNEYLVMLVVRIKNGTSGEKEMLACQGILYRF